MDFSHLFYAFSLIICLLSGGCGSLSNLVQMKSPILFEDKSSFNLKLMNCNLSVCLESKSKLHKRISKALEQNLLSKGHFLTQQTSDYQLLLLSAYEGEIEPQRPRNLYLIIRDEKGRELAQLAMAESFSSPLDQEHINIKELESGMIEKFNSLAAVPSKVAELTKKN
jgi:hypothetical protein